MNETIRGKATDCSFRMCTKSEVPGVAQLNADSDSVACSNIISVPHEYLYHTRSPSVRHCAVLGDRIRSSKFERSNICARHSYEEFSSETTISIKNEAPNRNKPCASCVQPVTSVQGCIGAMLSVLCLNPKRKAECNKYSLENSLS